MGVRHDFRVVQRTTCQTCGFVRDARDGRDFEPRTLRIFEAGHRGEDIVAGWLRLAGFDLRTERADGRQFGFSALDGKLLPRASPFPRASRCLCRLTVFALAQRISINNTI